MTGVIVATIAGMTDRPMTETAEPLTAAAGHQAMMTIATAAMTVRVMHATAMMLTAATVIADSRHRVATAEIRATGATATATALVHLTATLFVFGRVMPGLTANVEEREQRKI
jgi:hypothetical protein